MSGLPCLASLQKFDWHPFLWAGIIVSREGKTKTTRRLYEGGRAEARLDFSASGLFAFAKNACHALSRSPLIC
jgi:hypothetical protein